MSSPNPITATLIPGDGIGPETVESTIQILDALGSPFLWDVQQAGVAGIDALGDPLPEQTLASIRKHRLALKGPLTTPVGGGFRSSNVRLREEFELYANVRPAKTLIPGRFENIDIVLVRENLGGFKANILKLLTGIFLDAAREVAKEYEGRVEMDDMIVDACAMQLVLNPWRFDMLLCTNLFGDILSDQIAGLVGGLGMAPGANIGESAAIFEAVHGSAPDIAGKGVANPISILLASAMMLDHVGKQDLATRLRKAITDTLNIDSIRTRDLKGEATTKQFTDAVCKRLASG